MKNGLIKERTNSIFKIPYITYYSRSGSVDRTQTSTNPIRANIQFISYQNKACTKCTKCTKKPSSKCDKRPQTSKNNLNNKIESTKKCNNMRKLPPKCPYSDPKPNRKCPQVLQKTPNLNKNKNNNNIQKKEVFHQKSIRNNSFSSRPKEFKELYQELISKLKISPEKDLEKLSRVKKSKSITINISDLKKMEENEYLFINLDDPEYMMLKINDSLTNKLLLQEDKKTANSFETMNGKLKDKNMNNLQLINLNKINEINKKNKIEQINALEKKLESNQEKIKIKENINQIENIMNENFICPISHSLFNDPVFAEDGQTYERDGINQWLLISNYSPITHKLFGSKELIPNYLVKSQISNLKSQLNELQQKLKNMG